MAFKKPAKEKPAKKAKLEDVLIKAAPHGRIHRLETPSATNAVENITVTDFFDCQSQAPVHATAAQSQLAVPFNCVQDEDIYGAAPFAVSL